MKFLKEFSFQCFVFLVLFSLLFVGWDLSKPILYSEAQISAEDVAECIVNPFVNAEDDKDKNVPEVTEPGFSFLFNIVLPLSIYIACAGGLIYLILENLKLVKACSYQSKPGKLLWYLWLGVLGAAVLIPILFGVQLISKGFILAIIATVIFLLLLSIISKLGNKDKKYHM